MGNLQHVFKAKGYEGILVLDVLTRSGIGTQKNTERRGTDLGA